MSWVEFATCASPDPNPASPVLWAVLGAVVAGGIAGFVWFRHLAARAAR